MTHSLRRAKKQGQHHQQSQLKNLGLILLMMLSHQSPQSLLSPRKMQRARRKRRRILIQMTISSMKRMIILRRSYSLRAETTMNFSGMMMGISHNLPKRKRRRRSQSRHSTQVSLVDPLTPRLLLEETKEYKRKGLVDVQSVVNQWSVRKSKISVASILRWMPMKKIGQAKRVRVNSLLRKKL